MLSIVFPSSKEVMNMSNVSNISPQSIECGYHGIAMCGRSTHHLSCLALICLEGVATEKQVEKEFICYVCETPTFELVSGIT